MKPEPKTWEEVGAAVMRGEYDRADDSTIESILIGLRGTPGMGEAIERAKKIKPRTIKHPKL